MRQFNAEDTVIELRSWCQDWNDMAELIWRMRTLDNGDPIIKVYGYSFGGYSSMILARELGRRGLRVNKMVLCDPVYRHAYKLGWWRSCVPWSKIRIPPNVKEVYWVRQQNPRFGLRGGPWYEPWSWFHPAGHNLIWDPRTTIVHDPIILRAEHTYMDDTPEFQNLALEIASGVEDNPE